MGEGGVKSLESPATVRARLTSRPEFFVWNFQRAMTKKTAEKAKGGRPQHEPTPKDRQIVELLSGVGVPQKEICGLIGISLPTLHRCYRRELDQGAAKVQLRMIHHLFRLAEGKGGEAVKGRPSFYNVASGGLSSHHLLPRSSSARKQQLRSLRRRRTRERRGRAGSLARKLAEARSALLDVQADVLIDPNAPTQAKATAHFFATADKDFDKAKARLTTELLAARTLQSREEE
jgi:hypothetical protein